LSAPAVEVVQSVVVNYAHELAAHILAHGRLPLADRHGCSAEPEALAQGHFGLRRFVGVMTRFGSRTAHGEDAW